MPDGATGWRRALHGFQASVIASYGSALPYTITTGNDRNNDTNVNDRPAGVGRNTARAWSSASVDLRVSRPFRIGRARTEVLAEAFNLLNRTNLQLPNGVWGTGAAPLPAFGTAHRRRRSAAGAARSARDILRIEMHRLAPVSLLAISALAAVGAVAPAVVRAVPAAADTAAVVLAVPGHANAHPSIATDGDVAVVTWSARGSGGDRRLRRRQRRCRRDVRRAGARQPRRRRSGDQRRAAAARRRRLDRRDPHHRRAVDRRGRRTGRSAHAAVAIERRRPDVRRADRRLRGEGGRDPRVGLARRRPRRRLPCLVAGRPRRRGRCASRRAHAPPRRCGRDPYAGRLGGAASLDAAGPVSRGDRGGRLGRRDAAGHRRLLLLQDGDAGAAGAARRRHAPWRRPRRVAAHLPEQRARHRAGGPHGEDRPLRAAGPRQRRPLAAAGVPGRRSGPRRERHRPAARGVAVDRRIRPRPRPRRRSTTRAARTGARSRRAGGSTRRAAAPRIRRSRPAPTATRSRCGTPAARAAGG